MLTLNSNIFGRGNAAPYGSYAGNASANIHGGNIWRGNTAPWGHNTGWGGNTAPWGHNTGWGGNSPAWGGNVSWGGNSAPCYGGRGTWGYQEQQVTGVFQKLTRNIFC